MCLAGKLKTKRQPTTKRILYDSILESLTESRFIPRTVWLSLVLLSSSSITGGDCGAWAMGHEPHQRITSWGQGTTLRTK